MLVYAIFLICWHENLQLSARNGLSDVPCIFDARNVSWVVITPAVPVPASGALRSQELIRAAVTSQQQTTTVVSQLRTTRLRSIFFGGQFAEIGAFSGK